MSPSLAFLRRRSLRFRITSTFVVTALVLTGVLATATLVTVGRLLEEQRTRSSTRQTLFAVLFAQEFLASQPDPKELVSKLQIRQRFDAMVTSGTEWFATSLDLTPEVVPHGLRALVTEEERFGYEISRQGGERVLIFGSPLPPARTDLFLFFPLEDIDRTMSLLLRAMAIAGVFVVAATAVFARRVSTRILHPLAAVSGAAQRMAEGLLETRVEGASADELGQLTTSFNRMATALRDMIQHERHFVAAVSHELRTPLAALHAASEVVQTHRDLLPEDGREALDLIGEDLVALRELVEELMEVSELDSGRSIVRREEVTLRTFLEALIRRKRIEVVIEGPDPVVVTDKARLERIAGNLLDNAMTHGEGRDVRVVVAASDEDCRVTVSDRGPGIATADLPLLFGRFYKSDPSRTRDRGGVGLGLAIARENAHLLGGTVVASSDPGGGATFTVSLPREAPSTAEAS